MNNKYKHDKIEFENKISELKFSRDKLKRQNDINRKRIDELISETQRIEENSKKFQAYTNELVNINEQLVKRVSTFQEREKIRNKEKTINYKDNHYCKHTTSSRTKSLEKQRNKYQYFENESIQKIFDNNVENKYILKNEIKLAEYPSTPR